MLESERERARKRAALMLRRAGIRVTKQEVESMEVTDLGLNDHKNIGIQIIVYVNNERYCAKELILFPRQICPEHRHPPFDGYPGKQETFRCRWGTVLLYVPGERSPRPRARIPKSYEPYFTVWREIVLKPGDQYTLPPDTLHWFQAGDRGAIVSEFSSASYDEKDLFTDPRIIRASRM